MVKLYALQISPLLPENRWEALLPLLSPQRQQRILACRHGADRARLAGAGWLLRYALSQEGIPVHAQQFTTSPDGKPMLINGSLDFSLSHSGEWVLCAVSAKRVGVDVELPRCTLATARRFFAPEEVAMVEALPKSAQVDALLRLWTAKEAFTKALGTGLKQGLASFSVHLSQDGAVLEQNISPLPFRLEEYVLPGCRACLCTLEPRTPLLEVALPLVNT